MLLRDINRTLTSLYEGGSLPTMVYINKQSDTRGTVRRPLHSHDSICEILYIYKGEGAYLIGDRTYPLEEGCVVYYNQGDLHEVVSGTNHEIGDYCIGVTNLRRKGRPLNELVSPGGVYVRQSGSLSRTLKELCEEMFELEGTDDGGKLAAQFLFNAFLALALRAEEMPRVEMVRSEELRRGHQIREYLDHHFAEEITLESVGEALGCSATYVSHTFKYYLGITPTQYMIQRRIGLAQTLLISTNDPVTLISARVGYDNTNYFSTLFSKTVGMNPTKYRRLYKEEARGRDNQA